MLERAREFAIHWHGDQKYGRQPYIVHLDAVAQIAREYGDTATAVAYLHDVLEDTDARFSDLEREFGALIAECVAIVSDQPGDSREARKRKTYAKMSLVCGDTDIALVVKAADRLANTRACVADNNTRLLAVYQAEYPPFRQVAYRPGLCEPIWEELEAINSTRP